MTQTKAKAAELGGRKFEVFKLAPLDSQDLLVDLLDVIAPAFGAALEGAEPGEGGDPLDAKVNFGGGLARLFADGEKGKRILRRACAELSAVSTVDGVQLSKAGKFDETFRDDLALMYEWLWFAIRTQYANFSRLVPGGITAALGNVLPTINPSPTTSENGGS